MQFKQPRKIIIEERENAAVNFFYIFSFRLQLRHKNITAFISAVGSLIYDIVGRKQMLNNILKDISRSYFTQFFFIKRIAVLFLLNN